MFEMGGNISGSIMQIRLTKSAGGARLQRIYQIRSIVHSPIKCAAIHRIAVRLINQPHGDRQCKATRPKAGNLLRYEACCGREILGEGTMMHQRLKLGLQLYWCHTPTMTQRPRAPRARESRLTNQMIYQAAK